MTEITPEDLLLPHCQAIIEAYEKGLLIEGGAGNLNREKFLAIYLNPLTTVQQSVDSLLAAIQTPNYFPESEDQLGTKQSPLSKEEEKEEEPEGRKFKDYWCDIGAYAMPLSEDARRKWMHSVGAGKPYQIEGWEYETPVYDFSTNASKWMNEELWRAKGWEYDLEKCLNCKVDFQFEWELPKIDLLGDLGDILANIDKLIDMIESALNPDSLLKKLCEIYFSLGNILCPTNLGIILAALQALIVKYTSDMIKLRLDWTAVIGPIIKALLEGLISLLENIPRNVNPPLDCLINALTEINKYKKWLKDNINTTQDLIENIAEETLGAWDQTKDGLSSMFSANERVTDENKAKLDQKEKAIQGLLEAIKQLDQKRNETITSITQGQPELHKIARRLELKERELQELARDSGVTVKIINRTAPFSHKEYIFIIEDPEDAKKTTCESKVQEHKGILDQYKEKHAEYNKHLEKRKTQDDLRKSLQEQIKVKEIEQKIIREESGDYWQDVADAFKETFSANWNDTTGRKKTKLPDYTPDKGDESYAENVIAGIMSAPGEGLDWILGGLYDEETKDALTESKYIEHEFGAKLPSGITALIEKNKKRRELKWENWAQWGDDFEWIIMFINILKESKRFINEYYMNLKYALQSIGKLFDGSIGLDVKIAGYILFILDLIKIVRLIIKVMDKDFSCKEFLKQYVEESPSLVQISLGSTSNNLTSKMEKNESTGKDDSTDLDNENILVSTVDSRYVSMINIAECNSLFNGVADNPDDFYERVLRGFSGVT